MTQEKKDYTIHALQVLKDNIIWIWEEAGEAVVVDPALGEPTIDFLKKNNLTLNSVLQTHHHEDHIGGTVELINNWPSASVIASKADIERIPFQSQSVGDEDKLIILGHELRVLAVPGHTRSHIAYYLSDIQGNKKGGILFCGDTLFGAGCGRIFEGSYLEMFNSLNRIKSLPAKTKVFCAHEYTEANLRWANSIYPEDLLISKRLKNISERRAKSLLSLPSTIAEERETNLFFRAKDVEEFSQLRKHKDSWIN